MSRYSYKISKDDYVGSFAIIYKDDTQITTCGVREAEKFIAKLEAADVCRCFHNVHAGSQWLRHPNTKAYSGMCRSKDTLKSRT